ncbi:hypothetical protein [Streptomyces sp. NPDC001948]
MNTLALNLGTEIDWGNPGFLQMYAFSFGVSTILTAIFWLFAVAKRAAQGVHFGQALSESIGYLLMAVMVSAFAPAAVAYTVRLMDGAAESMLDSQALKITVLGSIVVGCLLLLAGTGIGAPLALIIGFSLIMILLGIWLLLAVRNALILCGLVFGPTVFSGLVNKDLWKHTKKWTGVMVAIISVKYVIYTVLALSIALTEGIPRNVVELSFGQALGTLISLLTLFSLALFAPLQIGKFVPIFGDELQAVLSARGTFVDQAKSAYEQGKSSLDRFKGTDNPRLGGGDSGGGGDEELAATAGPEAAIAAKAKQDMDEQQKDYEDAAFKGLGGGQTQGSGSEHSSNAIADSGSSSDPSSGSGGAFTPPSSSPPAESARGTEVPQASPPASAPVPAPAAGPDHFSSGEE